MAKLYFIIVLSIVLLLYSCKLDNKDKITKQIDMSALQDKQFEADNFQSYINLDFARYIIETVDTSQIKVIDEMCAISIIPDTSLLNLWQSEMEESYWNEIVFDRQYYEYLIIDTLKKHNIPTYFALREKRFIKFIKTNGTSYIIDLTKMQDAWGLILYNGNENPVLWNSVDINGELGEIFKLGKND